MASNVTGEPKLENTSHVEQVETQDDVPKRSAFKDVWANKRVMHGVSLLPTQSPTYHGAMLIRLQFRFPDLPAPYQLRIRSQHSWQLASCQTFP